MQEQSIEICDSATPIASVIWLHGLGADGKDFVPIVEMINLPNIRFVLPHAPYRNITINNGANMRAWYDIYGLNPGSPEDETGIRETQSYIEKLITKEIARGTPSKKIILAGFSQGGAIALHIALRYPQNLAGVIALSTYLPLQSSFKNEKTEANLTTPIFMAHGTQDEVISLETNQNSLKLLKSEQYIIKWHEYIMAHSVCMEEIADIKSFLMETLHL